MIEIRKKCLFNFRITWVFVVLAVVAVFAYALTDRILNYYTYPTNIDLNVGFWERVPFPAVTICNQNNYRYVAMDLLATS
jgi:hypothetical protein